MGISVFRFGGEFQNRNRIVSVGNFIRFGGEFQPNPH